MEQQFLTVKEVAELKGCTDRYVRTLIGLGKLNSIEVIGLNFGRGGIQYRIPLSSLDKKLQLKYKRLQRNQQKDDQNEIDSYQEEGNDIFIDEPLSASEQQEVILWKQIIKGWRSYRHTCGLCKAEADENYAKLINTQYPDINLNRRTLYRKWNLLNEKGETALVDKRGKHSNHTKKLTAYTWDIFEAFYLDESQKSITLCMELTQLELESQMKKGIISEIPELPKIGTFSREVNNIPIPYIEYFRHGEKDFIGKCAPYIKRMYDDLSSNDIWVADNHTFDIMLYDSEKPIRLYLTAFMDVRTRKMMGWCVTDRPCADATIYALKKGIEKYGIPNAIYTDNGREFLFHDFGGNGFRKKKQQTTEFKPPSILADLGIEFRTALPRNARAKGIERAFLTVKESFSKLYESYTGGSVAEKPEQLKEVVKNPDRMKTVTEFIQHVDTYLSGWYNKQPHNGEGMEGKTPDELYAKLLITQRKATQTQLDQMFMRWSNPLKVSKNGVTLTFYGKKLQYYDQKLWLEYFGKDVYVRYNPDDLAEIQVYDTEQRYICNVPLLEELSYHASKKEIAKAQSEKRAAYKAVTAYKKQKGIETQEALSLLLDKATENQAESEIFDPKIIQPVFGNLKKASGYEYEPEADEIDWTAALEKLKADKKGND